MAITKDQRQLLEELAKIMKVQGIASGGRSLPYYDEESGVDFDQKNLKASLAELNKQFKATSQKLKSNNKTLDNVIKRTTERAFESIVSRVTKSLPTRANVIRRMDDVFDGLEDSVDEFDRALGVSAKRLLREFNGNANELSKVKKTFGSVVKDMNEFSKLLDFGKPTSDTMKNMADRLADKMQELESEGLKELAESLKPTLDTLKKLMADSKDRVITEAEMDTLRKTILENLPKMASADEKMTKLFGEFLVSQREQSADFANTMKGAIALIGNDIRRLPGFITSAATNFQGDGFSASNYMTAFSQGMSPQDFNQMQLRYMVLQSRGQEAFNATVEDINANLRNDYGLTAEAQTQMRTVMLDVAKNLGAIDNANFATQVRDLTRVTEGIAKREGVSMQDAANMMLDISNEAYIQSRLIGKNSEQQIDVLKNELDTRSRLNKQLGINFEMQKQINREQRSRMFQGYAEKLAGGIRTQIAARMMGASAEDAKLLQQERMGALEGNAEALARAQAVKQRLMVGFEQGKREESVTGMLGAAGTAQIVDSELFSEATVNSTNAQVLAAQQLARTTASGDNAATIGATGVGTNDNANAAGGLGTVAVGVMRVQELIYAAGASPIGSILGGAAGTILELAQTAMLLRMGGGMGGGIMGKAGGLMSRAGSGIASGASGLLGRAGGSLGTSMAARGGLAAVGTVGLGAAGLIGAGYAGFNNTGQMFNPDTVDAQGNALTRDQITSSQVTGTMKNLAILAGGAIGLIGGPVGVAIGAGAGALVGEIGEAVSDYIPDWAKMLTPLGQISMGLEKGISQWKELTDIQGNFAEVRRIEQGVKDGTLQINEDLINSYADISDHGDGFWGGSMFTSSAEREAAAQRLNAIFAAQTGKVVDENGNVSNASNEVIDLGMQIIRELEMRREQAEELANRQDDTTRQVALDSKRQADVREQRAKLMSDVESRFNVSGAFAQVNLG
jgi:hypothetical protein